jgi:hypothetical protein
MLSALNLGCDKDLDLLEGAELDPIRGLGLLPFKRGGFEAIEILGLLMLCFT